MTEVKKTISKAKKNSIESSKVAKKTFFDYLDTFTFKMKPISEDSLDKLAEELVRWAVNDDDALKLSQFYIKHGFYDSDFYNWCARNKNLEIAHKTAMIAIGNRREIGAIKRKYDSGTINTSMSIYDKQWKELAEWKANLNKEKEQVEQKIIVIERFPESDK
jgi:hypothetical protein